MKHEKNVCGRPKKSSGASNNAASVDSSNNDTNNVSERTTLSAANETQGAHTIKPKCRKCSEICQSFKHLYALRVEKHVQTDARNNSTMQSNPWVKNNELPPWETEKK